MALNVLYVRELQALNSVEADAAIQAADAYFAKMLMRGPTHTQINCYAYYLIAVDRLDEATSILSDESKTEDVVEHFLEEIETDLFCVVQPTSPLLSSGDVVYGCHLLEDDRFDFDSIISVCRETNYYWDIKGKPINFELGKRKRTQEHTPWFKENGAFYITTKDKFLENFSKYLIFNKGFIPSVFQKSENPTQINWIHIDLNSSEATRSSLEFFFDKLSPGGVILFDDYGGFDDTRKIVDEFLKNKKGHFTNYPTGQGIFIKI